MSLLVVGSVAFDTITNPHGSVKRALGGSATYFSAAASALTAGDPPVQVVGVVGEDYDLNALNPLVKRGVDLSGLERRPGETFYWEGEYRGDLSEAITLTTQLNVFEHFDPKLDAAHKAADVLFLANIAPPLQERVRNEVTNPRFVGLDTMNFWIHSGLRGKLLDVLTRVDVLFANEREICDLGEHRDPIAAARAVIAAGVGRVAVKLGGRGAMLVSAGDLLFVPAYPLCKVKDTTGAGDSFAAGFMATVAQSPVINAGVLHHALVNGTITASFAVEDFSLNRLMTLDRAQFFERRRDYARLFTLPAGLTSDRLVG